MGKLPLLAADMAFLHVVLVGVCGSDCMGGAAAFFTRSVILQAVKLTMAFLNRRPLRCHRHQLKFSVPFFENPLWLYVQVSPCYHVVVFELLRWYVWWMGFPGRLFNWLSSSVHLSCCVGSWIVGWLSLISFYQLDQIFPSNCVGSIYF